MPSRAARSSPARPDPAYDAHVRHELGLDAAGACDASEADDGRGQATAA